MPDNNIKIGVQISDGGSAGKTSNNVKDVKDVLDQTTVSANKATKAISAMNAAQAGGGRATTAKIKQATGGGGGEDERGMYAAQRATVGTGAAGRDFSKESQGLGGLVRLYATFAANIYAVGAAFNALSQAMDTTNMVKGLDQLGAAQGRNLGSLAKQLVSATDGAISLRDALTATAQASSSGMSNEAILKLGNVAKKASQALGVAMPDAISRLSRGITKIEPELLDELGIFVKIDKATEDYARTVGKSASTLTDFEKRQAFANAVLEEGSRKFAAINIDTNPYEKIAATFQNLVQSGLELVNKVLTPITTLFASSPTALGVTIALFAKSLLGQALPVLGKWKTGLADAAEAARQNVIATNKARQSLIGDISEKTVLDAVEAKKAALDRVDAGVARLQKVKGFAKTASLIPAGGLDDETVKALEARSKAINDSYTKGQTLTEKTIAAKKREEAAINSVTSAYREQALQEVKLQKILDENQTKISRSISLNAAANRIADAAAAKSQRVGIVSSVAGEVSARGLSGSFEELNRQIALARDGKDALGKPFEDGQKKMSVFNAGLTRTIGTVTILTSALGTMASSLGIIGVIVTAVLALYEGLDAIFGTSAKQAKAFSESMDTLDSSIENVSKTIENINTKKLVDFFSVESTQAKANAVADLSDSVGASVTKFQKLADAQSDWDKKWDSIFDFFGKGSGDKLADGLSKSIIAGISAIESPEAKAQFQEKIKGILNVSDADLVSAKALDSAIDKLTSDKKISSGKAIADAFVVVKENTAKAANNLVSFRDALTEGNKLVDTMNASLKPTDNLGKVGDVLINASFKLGTALKDPVNAFTAIKELVNNTKVLSLLPPEEGMRLATMRNQVNQLAEDSARNEKTLEEAIKRRIKLEEQYNAEKGRIAPQSQRAIERAEQQAKREAQKEGYTPTEQNRAAQAASDKLRAADELRLKPSKDAFESAKKFEEAALRKTEELQKEKARLVQQEQEGNLNIYKAGAKALEQSLKGAFAEAGIIVARGYLSLIASAGGQTGVEEASLKQQELNIQIQNIKQLFENSQQLKRLTLAVEKDTNSRDIIRLEALQATKAFGGEQLSAEDRIKLDNMKQRQSVIEGVQAKLGGITVRSTEPGMTGSGRGSDAKKSVTTQDLIDMELGSMKAEQVKMQGETAKLYAQIEAIDIDKKIVIPLRNAAKLEKERLEYAANAITRKVEEQDQLISIVGVYNRELQTRKDILAQDLLANKYAQDTKDLLTSQQILQDALATKKLDAVGTAAAERTIEQNNVRLSEIKLSFEDKLAKLKQSQFIQDLQKTEDLRKQEAARQGEILENSRQVQLSKLSIREAELGFLTATGRISEKAVANEQYQIALIKQQLDYERESLALANAKLAIDSEQRVKQESLALMPKTITVQGDTPEQKIEIANSAYIIAEKALTEETAKKNALLDSQKEKLEAANAARNRGLQLTLAAQLETAATNKRLEEQAVAMEKLQGVAQALGTVFGEFGKSLGTGLESILKATQDFTNKREALDKKYAKDRLDLEKSQAEEISIIQSMGELGANTEEDELKAKKKFGQDSIKLEKNNAKKSEELELDKNIAIASSAKSMFKEKTFAHKAFATFEKLMMVAKLAMLAQEAAATVANAAVVVPAEGAKAAASGLSAIMKALNLPPPFGFIAGAAMAAIVASFLGNAVSGNVSIPAGSTAEERQEVQSTGQKYVDGKLVETGLGVLGDPTAELETIANGIDRLEKHSIGSLDLSNGMLDALKAIRENTGSFVTALVRTNITKQDPGSSGGNWLFGKSSTENIDKLLSISGTLQEVIEQTADINQIVVNKVSSSGFLGFGGGTSVQRVVQKFEPEQQGEIERSLSLLFTSFADTVEAGATALNLQLQPSWKALYKLPDDFETSLLNMSYEDVGKALEAGLGQVLGDFVRNTYPQLTRFQTAGEDLGSMFIRLGSDSQSLKAAFATVGTNLQTFTETTTNISTAAQRANTESLRVEKERIEGLIAAQALVRDAASGDEYEAARNSIYYLGLELATATTAYNNSLRLYNSGLNVSTTLNIEAEQRIIKANGGMDSFIERIKDFSKEILTAGDRTEIAGKSYGDFITGLVTTARTADTAARTALGNVPSQPDTVGPGGTVTTLGGYTMTRDVFGDIAAWQANGGLTRTAAEGNVAQTSEALAFAERLSSVKTRQEFKELYRSIDQSTDSGAKFAAVMLKIAPQFAEITDALEKYNTALEDQKVKMGALGIAGGLSPDEAKSLERERQRIKIREEYTTVQAAELITNQNAIWLAEDSLDITKREIALLSEQGYTYSALLENRKLELSLLTEEQRVRQVRLYAIQDQNKTNALNIRLMEASGDVTGALYQRRVLELRGMSESDQEIQRRIWLLEDEKKATNDTTNLAIELMEAEGDTIGALNARRTQELKGLSLAAQEMKIRIWTLQDEKKILTAKNAQEIKIYELLGNASEALRLQREAELASMDAVLRPNQRYIYALQDQRTIYDKLKTAISNTTASLKQSIQTLKDYQLSLRTGDKTILKPEQVYALRKQEFFNLKTIAESVATTPVEEAAKAAAISSLPNAADAFLESSRTLFASGQAYTDDFNLIDSILTSLGSTLTGQLSDAERSLNELKDANGFLEGIEASTESTADLMAEFVAANANVAIARAAASAASGTGTSGGVPGLQPVASTATGNAIPPVQQQLTLNDTLLSDVGLSLNERIVKSWYMTHPDAQKTPGLADIRYWVVEGIDKWAGQYSLDAVKESFSQAVANATGKPKVPITGFYARGGVANGLSLVGEEGPELVDFNTPGRVYPAGQTTAMLANNTALVEEIKALRQEVEKLRNEQKEQTGHLITTNYDANRIAAEMLAKATAESSKEAAWANRSAAKVV